MDLLRAAIKAMYYDYPIENAYGIIVENDKKKNFLEHFNRLACGEDDGFSHRDMAAYKDYLLDLLNDQRPRCENNIQYFAGLPQLFASEVLTTDDMGNPRVVFSNLFRWREVVKCVGEDLFITSYLAKTDRQKRSDFFWPNVLPHNHDNLNAVLDGGLTDIHSHFGGAIDSFHFNWICLMNNAGALDDLFKQLKESFNNVAVFDKEYAFLNLSSWCRVAAAIRASLYRLLVRGQLLNANIVKEDLKGLLKSGSKELTALTLVIDNLRSDAMKTNDGIIIDYAIGKDLIPDSFLSSPYSVYGGERLIEYAFFREYHNPQSKMKGLWVELFYLYELIKTHLRKEFVFANEMWGLDNYIGFEARSPLFYKDLLQPICNLFSMQTSIRRNMGDKIESRVTSNALGLTTGDYGRGLFSKEPFLKKEEMKKRLTFVVSLSKGIKKTKEHINGRCNRKWKEVYDEFHKVALFVADKKSEYPIVGIDVGGLEFYYRPEVFAHALRAAKHDGFGITYHVAEEFYDLADGLRAIWEIITYVKLNESDRLGHCLALGITPFDFYQRKHCTMTMTKQVLLDNLVWLLGFAKSNQIAIKAELNEQLLDKAMALYTEIGYGCYYQELNVDDYFDSLFLRSDETYVGNGLDVWSVTSQLESLEATAARANVNAKKLFMAYRLDEDIINRGEKSISVRFDKDYVELVAQVQQAMINFVAATGICIESCPSSNLQIGRLGRYDSHPAIAYYLEDGINPKLNLAICTDDKGTFATSLPNELSLLALAVEKKFGWNENIENGLVQLIAQGDKYCFKNYF